MEKLFGIGALTVTVTVTACVAEGLVAVTVSGYVPGVALVSALTVSVALPAPVMEATSIEAVTPAGAPVTESAMVSAEPLVTAVVRALVPTVPWVRLRLVGFALIEKSLGGGAITVSPTVTECELEEPVAVMVNA